MPHTNTQLQDDIRKNLQRLQTLRDEVRVRLHLASMDAKDEWSKLEPRLAKVEREVEAGAQEVSEASRKAVADAVKKLQKFWKSIS